jgi:hypothetical protein
MHVIDIVDYSFFFFFFLFTAYASCEFCNNLGIIDKFCAIFLYGFIDVKVRKPRAVIIERASIEVTKACQHSELKYATSIELHEFE